MNTRAWLERHAQTLVGSLGRLAQQPLASAMTVAVIGVALALPLLLGVLLQNSRAATAHWNQAFDMSVYLDKKVPASRLDLLAQQLRARRDVAAIAVIPADQALAQFRVASGLGDALNAVGDNPLPDTLVVTPTVAASTRDGLAALRNAIAAAPGVHSVQADTEWVRRLHAVMDIVKHIVWVTAAILSLGVFLVIGNTIRLDILNRRSEIEVMKLVGATNGFARRPFLYSGACYGFGGGLLALILVGSAEIYLSGPIERLAGLYGSQFRLRGLGFVVSLGVLIVSAVLGWSGSWLAASRHIKGIEPS